MEEAGLELTQGTQMGRRVSRGGLLPGTDWLPLVLQLGKVYGVESHVLSPAETKTLYPLMNVDDLYGTLYVPHDGTMDPAGTCSALARAAAARGAQVLVATGPGSPAPSPHSCLRTPRTEGLSTGVILPAGNHGQGGT